MRLSLAEARRLGLIPKIPRRSPTKRPGQDPQQMIYEALVDRLGGSEVVFEAVGLIPGRRFRADIYLPTSRIVVEMDGFQYHRSKTAFQRDRERQNLFALNGFLVLRYFAGKHSRDLYGIVDQIIQAHESRCPRP